MRVAALGDSITLGIGDPVPSDGWRGWAALLSESLRDSDFRNFAAADAVSRTGRHRPAAAGAELAT